MRLCYTVAVAAILLAGAASAQTPCTIAANCTGHANAVKGNSAEGCICTCRSQWYGASCQFCPPGVDPSKDCNECLPGYEGFPFCALSCTVGGNCSNHASAVQGDSRTGCKCNCTNLWTGPTCDTCPPGVDGERNCGACLPGYSGYPFCSQSCTNQANCNDHASQVSGNLETGCQCTCRNQWYGANCGACPPGLDAGKDCGECLPGYVNYPQCALACTNAGNCSGHAASVQGTSKTGCDCMCRNQWVGPTCATCPPGFDASKDCAACLPGYSGYPFCAKTCTVADSCDGHASSVSGNAQTGCQCTCTNSWAGGMCNYCPPNFDSAQDCAACAAGFQNYPFCTAASLEHAASKKHVELPPRRFNRH